VEGRVAGRGGSGRKKASIGSIASVVGARWVQKECGEHLAHTRGEEGERERGREEGGRGRHIYQKGEGTYIKKGKAHISRKVQHSSLALPCLSNSPPHALPCLSLPPSPALSLPPAMSSSTPAGCGFPWDPAPARTRARKTWHTPPWHLPPLQGGPAPA
jgi:hypothetical protein